MKKVYRVDGLGGAGTTKPRAFAMGAGEAKKIGKSLIKDKLAADYEIVPLEMDSGALPLANLLIVKRAIREGHRLLAQFGGVLLEVKVAPEHIADWYPGAWEIRADFPRLWRTGKGGRGVASTYICARRAVVLTGNARLALGYAV